MEFSSEQEDAIKRSGEWKQLACTYVGDYHVTTCYRESSVFGDNGWYYETFVWSNDNKEEGKKRDIVYHSDYGHALTCEKIIQEGAFWDNNQKEVGE